MTYLYKILLPLNMNYFNMKEIVELHEFTWDMVRGLPSSYYHYINKIPHKVIHKPNLEHLYKFNSQNIESSEFNEVNDMGTYSHSRPDFTLREWTPPPLKSIYQGKFNTPKPLIVVQNKYAVEWGQGIFNYFPLEVLDIIFSEFKENYSIVYIRPDGNSKGYYKDQNPIKEFQDYELIKDKHPEVICFNDLLDKFPTIEYNTLQFMVEANSSKHITTSGGNACIAAYFGGEVIIFDSVYGAGAGRGIWKTDSWLKDLGGAKIYGVNSYDDLINTSKELWKF